VTDQPTTTTADANLIAAAPDLLVALRNMLAIYPYIPCGVTRAAEAAIAKAEGGPS
jgi:hypothetical protein